MDLQRYYTPGVPLLRSKQETKTLLGVGLTTVDTLLNEGRLQGVRIGRRRLVTDDSICRLIKTQAEILEPRN